MKTYYISKIEWPSPKMPTTYVDGAYWMASTRSDFGDVATVRASNREEALDKFHRNRKNDAA